MKKQLSGLRRASTSAMTPLVYSSTIVQENHISELLSATENARNKNEGTIELFSS